ncbi:SpoIIE family protein phosphatase [Pseudacidovorax intermedius]|uniref:Protein serine/threonine phosphatase n=1 Tax=Pseudacidovorax intermedius TaxID=433924 RepID=A0A147GLS1_9BURK|nr:SpoIIE family protein phosphatase [Pseudacidovorax intermedius]KTT14547.1 protein serine/threonine phosphatase [Pseudacidovorax intermedius]
MAAASPYLSDFRPRFRPPSAADLCLPVPCMTADETNEKAMEVFSRHRDLTSLPVVEDGRPIGLINRNIFLSQMSKPYRMELYGRKSCIAFMDKEPLMVDGALDIDALTFRAVEFGEKALADGFIVTKDGAFAGVGSGLQLMRVVADMQAARNRQIMLSIEYASVIQQAMLRPSRDALARACPAADLVWEPRDVVGGDFFHFRSEADGWFGALADCTGHGVPGAFMTLIASTSLGQAIERHGPREPGRLLAGVNRGIKQVLGQMDGADETPGSDDGLDAACFWFDPARCDLVFAGARLSLFVRRPGAAEVELVEGHRRGVGYVDSPLDQEWPDRRVQLAAGSLVFVTTDGLIDQIGGPRAIALGKRRVRELLLAQPEDAAPADVNRAVADTLRAWQGEHHRRDDLTFFCFRA